MDQVPGRKTNPSSTIRSMLNRYWHACIPRTQAATDLFLKQPSDKGAIDSLASGVTIGKALSLGATDKCLRLPLRVTGDCFEFLYFETVDFTTQIITES